MNVAKSNSTISPRGNIAPLAALFLLLAACSPPPEPAQHFLEQPNGFYEIVAFRKASDVASVVSPADGDDLPIGQSISFSGEGLSMAGLGCESWEIAEQSIPVINLDDPLLSDMRLGPTDSPLSAGDQRIMKSFSYACEGEPFVKVLQVDDRVIVIPWANSSGYLVAEIPLTSTQIMQLQRELKSMKFYSGEQTGEIDEATRLAIGRWAAYRSMDADAYTFYRPALTENLLDALGVLDAKQ